MKNLRDNNHHKPFNKKKVMWGKYSGKFFHEVPTEYLEWFVANAYDQMVNRKEWAIKELEKRKNL